VTWIDALLVTVMGMGVTFVGLLLTNLAINSFALLPKLLRTGATGEGAPTEQQVPSVTEPASQPAVVTPDTLAAIVAVLAIEIRLARSYSASRFTFKSQDQQQGWSDEGRLIVNPYQRGRV